MEWNKIENKKLRGGEKENDKIQAQSINRIGAAVAFNSIMRHQSRSDVANEAVGRDASKIDG